MSAETRSGTFVAVMGGGLREELIFDPDTGDMLGTRMVVVTAQAGLEDGDFVSADSTEVSIVDTIPAE